MAKPAIRAVTDQKIWEDFVSTQPEANFLHSWLWGVFHKRLGKDIVRYGAYKNGQLVGVVQAIVEPARRGKHVVVVGGPLIDWQDQGVVTEIMSALREFTKRQGCIFIRMRPQLLDTPAHRQLFHKLGFRKAPMHVTADLTSQLDVSKPDDELRRMMRKGTRYEINRAAKLGIKVEAATDDRFLKEFCDLQMATARRQKFVPFSEKFLSEQFRTFAEAGKVIMYRASLDGDLLAMAFIIFYGQEAAYHYGASTDLARKIPGAYAIQWEAIQEARRRDCQRYNFWGVAEHGATKHRFYGVSVFKRGFGGQDVAYLPAHDLKVQPFKYVFTYFFETLRRKLRHL
ncbi:MAG TPA: peptidoglycan bridge formation glycyltransferase FemA/FemB family protein [Candidatus Saccharimonadales bacterium]|nr:peptidoglycan bridge formation glycyltransferase FemA/FemB family protein [Candidatus Saccharimonadales bacterium]